MQTQRKTIGDGVKTCLVCGAPLDAEGISCTRINAPTHRESQSYYFTVRPITSVGDLIDFLES